MNVLEGELGLLAPAADMPALCAILRLGARRPPPGRSMPNGCGACYILMQWLELP